MSENDCSQVPVEDFNLAFHIGSIFIVLAVSFLGTLIPVVSKLSPAIKINSFFYVLLKGFGMGVILATGYIHLLVPGISTLQNPCLPEVFLSYEAWGGVLALLSTLLIQFVQTIAIDHFGKKHDHGAECETHDHQAGTNSVANGHVSNNNSRLFGGDDIETAGNVKVPLQRQSSLNYQSTEQIGESSQAGRSKTHATHNTRSSATPLELNALAVATNIHSDGCCEVDHVLFKTDHEHTKITAYILELGLAAHGIIMGITLGVTGGEQFKTLLVAICFHQFFEGAALSVTALEAGFDTMTQPLLMALFYTLTTPIGQAIGISIAQSYNQNSAENLIITGVFLSLSGGILLYDSLVNLITVNITHSKAYSSYSIAKKSFVFLSLWLGAGVMAAIGYWA
ncbi:hypothetical protein MP228_003623 [Amoeboaphelidium protococcarum]|nr:hypothetical protein MP228_003623 [Amoeboaphelidium protococcarum]